MAKTNSDLKKSLKLVMPANMDYHVPLTTTRDIEKFIKRIERIVRSSMEYKDWIIFLKENVGLDRCVFFQNITNEKSKGKISLEMHHEPFTLYDIVMVVVNKFQKEGQPINDLFIADEVARLHYENKIGLIPLSKTAHQMVHNSEKLSIPLNMVYGSYIEFLQEYDPYIDDEMGLYEKVEKKVEMTEKMTPADFQAITKEFTYLDIQGVTDIERMELLEQKELA